MVPGIPSALNACGAKEKPKQEVKDSRGDAETQRGSKSGRGSADSFRRGAPAVRAVGRDEAVLGNRAEAEGLVELGLTCIEDEGRPAPLAPRQYLRHHRAEVAAAPLGRIGRDRMEDADAVLLAREDETHLHHPDVRDQSSHRLGDERRGAAVPAETERRGEVHLRGETREDPLEELANPIEQGGLVGVRSHPGRGHLAQPSVRSSDLPPNPRSPPRQCVTSGPARGR